MENKYYVPVCFYFNDFVDSKRKINQCIYSPICFYFNPLIFKRPNTFMVFTFQYVSILIHRPDSRFFSTLFPNFLLTSQSLPIFYHISFINSTKEKKNHLFFMLIEFCRCMGIFTLSEVDSLKIVVME